MALALWASPLLAPGEAAAEQSPAATTPPASAGGPAVDLAEAAAQLPPPLDRFLDRLMMVESGGRDRAANPRSTAVGTYQFITTTFLDVVGRHFPAETAGLSTVQVLALRADRAFARRAAAAFTLDNAALLAAAELPTSFAHLRLAHLLGPTAAVRLLQAQPVAPVLELLGAGVVRANPFMRGMRVQDLAAWSARDMGAEIAALIVEVSEEAKRAAQVALATQASLLAATPASATGKLPVPAPAAKPALAVTCNLQMASCRKYVALADKRTAMAARAVAKGVRVAANARRTRVR